MNKAVTQSDDQPILSVSGLSKRFPIKRGVFGGAKQYLHAVDDVSFELRPRETLGIVGESGCGKSTTARMIVRLAQPSGGRIDFAGTDITNLSPNEMRPHRRALQFVFQDPYSSLNQRMRAADIVAEPMHNFTDLRGKELRERLAWLFDRVGLRKDMMDRFPHEFSGGQRQRLGIARALAVNPSVIVADEPVSALDVSVQAQVINLMMDLQKEFNLAYLFIAHDLAVVQHISHHVAVMYLGKVVEIADRDSLFSDPQHPYTEALLDSVPIPDPEMRRESVALSGEVPSPINPPSGCRFHTRCPFAFDRCRKESPKMRQVKQGHSVACHLREPQS
ncbi:dipeptide ABC transporter ATP-binding protein [Pikeienuella piscinae]|uniref:Dipeptide ABC transporter ATP-binding protein n=1 Tax=Pikeienuella piscinae TaxID=2748098 RepID=A0A7L5C3B5_9RHOB|nr:dipeptide ABC transporter ATP-binding protein [Pikeienuella piscinae]QIE56744.1 dipeptide ABC transporter ATP-binding protein [Pikeienuella piscinae]